MHPSQLYSNYYYWGNESIIMQRTKEWHRKLDNSMPNILGLWMKRVPFFNKNMEHITALHKHTQNTKTFQWFQKQQLNPFNSWHRLNCLICFNTFRFSNSKLIKDSQISFMWRAILSNKIVIKVTHHQSQYTFLYISKTETSAANY